MKACLHFYITLITLLVLRQSPLLVINGGDCSGRTPHILCLFTEKSFQVQCGLKTQVSPRYFYVFTGLLRVASLETHSY